MFRKTKIALRVLYSLIILAMVAGFGLGISGYGSPVFAQANMGPPAPVGKTPSADFWRKIRQGNTGYVAGPASKAPWLIRRVDQDKKCIKAGTCTERLVGFVVPIHKKMPPVRQTIGKKASRNELYFVGGLAAILLLAGLAFLAFGLGPRNKNQATA